MEAIETYSLHVAKSLVGGVAPRLAGWRPLKRVPETRQARGCRRLHRGDRPGKSELKFLPNERRTKGITALTGYVNTALKVLDFVQNGATHPETVEFYQQEQPQLKEISAKSQISTIRHTLGLLKLEGSTLRPSVLGQKLMDTEDPTILISRVLTRVIGFDVLLYDLKVKSPRDRKALLEAQKKNYPNWTSNFAPSSQLAWAKHLGMVEVNGQEYTLTETGLEWAERIKERPEPFHVEPTEGSRWNWAR